MLTTLKKIIVPLIIVSMIFSFAPLPGTHKAQAIWGAADITFDPANWVTSLSTLWNNIEKYLKEYVLDALAWVVAKELIGEITDSIVEWINNGFDGQPTFINSFDDFLKNAVNAGLNGMVEVLNQDGINLCGEFSDKIKLNFTYHEAFRHSVKCTYQDVIDNVESFYGDIQEGGWSAFMTMNVQPENDPDGAYMESWAMYVQKMQENEAARETESTSGGGFQGVKKCIAWRDGGSSQASGDDPCTKYETLTPGKTVAARLEAAAGTDIRQLELADEISEIVGALANLVMTNIFEGDDSSNPRGIADRTPVSATLADNAGATFTTLWTESQSYYTLATTMIGTVTLLESTRQQIIDNYTITIANLTNIISCINGGITCLGDMSCFHNMNYPTTEKIEEIKDWVSDLTKYSSEKIQRENEKDAAEDRLADSADVLADYESFWNDINGVKVAADTNGDNNVTTAELTAVGITTGDISDYRSTLSDLKKEIDDDNNKIDRTQYYKETAKEECENCDDDPADGALSCTVIKEATPTTPPGSSTMVVPAADCTMKASATTRGSENFWDPSKIEVDISATSTGKTIVVGYKSYDGINAEYQILDNTLEDATQPTSWQDIRDLTTLHKLWTVSGSSRTVKADCEVASGSGGPLTEGNYINVFSLDDDKGAGNDIGEIAIFECSTEPAVCSGSAWPTQ